MSANSERNFKDLKTYITQLEKERDRLKAQHEAATKTLTELRSLLAGVNIK